MGCLFFVLEVFVDTILDGWIELMGWIVPQYGSNKICRTAMKIIVWIFSGVLFIFMFLGGIALLFGDEDTRWLGKYSFFIPLGISVIQISIGLVVRLVRRKR